MHSFQIGDIVEFNAKTLIGNGAGSTLFLKGSQGKVIETSENFLSIQIGEGVFSENFSKIHYSFFEPPKPKGHKLTKIFK